MKRAFLILALVFFPQIVSAQTGMSIGVEGDWLRALALGNYVTCSCGQTFREGSGNGFRSALRIALPIEPDLRIEGAVGYKRLRADYASKSWSMALIEPRADPGDTDVVIGLRHIAHWQADYLTIASRVSYRVLDRVNVSVGPELGLYLSGREYYERRILDTSFFKFKSSGQAMEVKDDGLISNAETAILSLHLQVEYDIPIGSFSILPNVQGSYLLTSVFSDRNSGINVSALSAGLGVLYHL